MADRILCVSVLSLEPGARLAYPARRPDGGVLLPAGAELDADQVRMLVQREIECVHVLQEETRDAAGIEKEVADAAARVAHLFRGKSSEVRDELGRAIADYRRRCAS